MARRVSCKGGTTFGVLHQASESAFVYDQESNTEGYDRIYENDFLEALENPLSTFSIGKVSGF